MPVDGIKRDLMSEEEKIWHTLKYGSPRLRVIKHAREDGPPEQPCYLEYILTDKLDEDVK